jgi:hypothetical protein
MVDRARVALSDALSSLGDARDADTVQWRLWLEGSIDDLDGGLSLLGRHPERERWIRGLRART